MTTTNYGCYLVLIITIKESLEKDTKTYWGKLIGDDVRKKF